MSHEEYKQMIPARRVGLDPAEDRMLASHLVQCSECRQELYEWQATAAVLVLGVDGAEPSPQVRERILVKFELTTTMCRIQVIPFHRLEKRLEFVGFAWRDCGNCRRCSFAC